MLTLTRAVRSVTTAAVVALAASASADAQFSGGVKGGLGQSSYTGKHEFVWRVTGPNSSAFVNWSGGGRISPQLEIGEYQRLGISTTGGSRLTFSATYIEALFLAKYSLGHVLGVRPYVLAGPTVVYAAKCNVEFVTAGLTSHPYCFDSVSTGRMDFGFAMAAGLGWTVGTTTLGLEARGSTGFRSVVVPLESQASRSLTWSVLASVSVPLHFNFGRGRQPTGVPTLPGVGAAQGGAGVFAESPPVAPPELSRLPGAGASTKRITVTAVDADARSLLIAIAREAGISLIVSTDVRRRVSVSFKDAAPEDAIRAIIADAGLSIAAPPSSRALPAVVFYQLPVNVDDAPEAAIAARFGVSSVLAKWIVESRPTPPAPPARQDKQP